MPLHPITTRQFVGGTGLVTLAFACLMLTQGEPAVLFTFPILLAGFLTMSPDAYKRPLTRKDLLMALAAVLAIAAFIAWCITHPSPRSNSSAHSLLDSFSHPAIAVPLWFAYVYLLCRRWRVKPPLHEEHPDEHSR